jgi:hypothetical protein
MKRPTRVQVYEGLYRSQADERFRSDALEAAKHGWRPVEGFWNGEELSVTYVHAGPDWRSRAPEEPTLPVLKAPRSRRRTILRTSVLLLVTLAAVLVIALLAGVGDIRRMIPA